MEVWSAVVLCFFVLAMEFHEKLQSLGTKEGLKGSKVSRAVERFSWNITILKVSYTLMHAEKAQQPIGAEYQNMFQPLAGCSYFVLSTSLPSPLFFVTPASWFLCSPSFLTPRARLTCWNTPRLKSWRTWSRSVMLLWLETSPRREPD